MIVRKGIAVIVWKRTGCREQKERERKEMRIDKYNKKCKTISNEDNRKINISCKNE